MYSGRNGLYDYAFSKVSVSKVLDSYGLNYQRRGNELWMCCPFHNEEDPSFSINEERKLFICWGCHEHGNVFSLVQKLNPSDMSYREAVLKCCKICGIEISESDMSDYLSGMDDDISDILEFDEVQVEQEKQQVFVESALSKFKRKTHNYFVDRGFKQETLNYLEMGFLAGDSKDVMNNRCVFPIRNIDGGLVGWTGRTVLSDVQPKWLHAPKGKFKKQYNLFNIDKAISYVYDTGEINVVESVANVARLIESGRYNTVATLGAGISRYQFDMLVMYAHKIIFWYDWDNGGFTGIQLALSYTSDYDSVFVAVTDYGCDAEGWALDLGDVNNDAVYDTKIISAYEFLSYIERRFVSGMDSSFVRDTKLALPDGTEIICANELKADASLPQLTPDDVLFMQNIDNLFGVKKVSVYNESV